MAYNSYKSCNVIKCPVGQLEVKLYFNLYIIGGGVHIYIMLIQMFNSTQSLKIKNHKLNDMLLRLNTE